MWDEECGRAKQSVPQIGFSFTKRKREKPTNMFDRERTNQIDITLNASRASTSESYD